MDIIDVVAMIAYLGFIVGQLYIVRLLDGSEKYCNRKAVDLGFFRYFFLRYPNNINPLGAKKFTIITAVKLEHNIKKISVAALILNIISYVVFISVIPITIIFLTSLNNYYRIIWRILIFGMCFGLIICTLLFVVNRDEFNRIRALKIHSVATDLSKQIPGNDIENNPNEK